jgi:hypothetical protein
MRVNEACWREVSVESQGMRLVSWRKHPLLRALPMARLFMQHHSEASTSTFPRSLACLIAICSPKRHCFAPAQSAILFPWSGSRIPAIAKRAGGRSAQTDRRLWCVYDGEIHLHSRGTVCSCCALRLAARIIRVPAVVAPSVLIIVSLKDAISAFCALVQLTHTPVSSHNYR